MNFTPAALSVLDIPTRLLARAEMELKKCTMPAELPAYAVRYVAALNRFHACSGYVYQEQTSGREPSLQVIYAGAFNCMSTDEMETARKLFAETLQNPEYKSLADFLASLETASSPAPAAKPVPAKAKKAAPKKKAAKKKVAPKKAA